MNKTSAPVTASNLRSFIAIVGMYADMDDTGGEGFRQILKTAVDQFDITLDGLKRHLMSKLGGTYSLIHGEDWIAGNTRPNRTAGICVINYIVEQLTARLNNMAPDVAMGQVSTELSWVNMERHVIRNGSLLARGTGGSLKPTEITVFWFPDRPKPYTVSDGINNTHFNNAIEAALGAVELDRLIKAIA